MSSYDPFGLEIDNSLGDFVSLLTTYTIVLTQLKIYMEQKGIKLGGIQVSVNVAPVKINLMIGPYQPTI
jgi:hypothetical protein